jgi:hypothetical protein
MSVFSSASYESYHRYGANAARFARELVTHPIATSREHGGNMSGVAQGAANGLLIANMGWGGTPWEAAAGAALLGSNLVATIFGRGDKGWAVNAAIGASALYVMQAPKVYDLQPLALYGVALLTVGTLPSLAAPWQRLKSEAKRQEWKDTAFKLTTWVKDKYHACLEHPRVVYSACAVMSLAPFLANDIMQKNWRLMPVYGLWLLGNVLSAISRPAARVQAPALAAPAR